MMARLDRQWIDGERISSIDNFLSGAECEQLIARAEENGFQSSPSSGGGHGRTHREDPRNNQYTIIADTSFANQLYQRISPYLPQTMEWLKDNAYFTKEIGGREWRLAGCVDRLRFYKYEKNEEYPEHMDGSYSRTVTINDQSYRQHSFLTLLIYLNENYEGGETKFYPDKQHCRFLRDIEDKQPVHIIQPKQGKALINLHQILHEGSKIQSGTKYVLRTDILYQKSIEPHPKLEKFQLKNNKNREAVVLGEWEKHFEPSCKMYHD